MGKTTYRTLKEYNIGRILKKVIEEEDVTRIKISKDIELPKSTISDLVNFLIAKQVIIETIKGETIIGKKPIILKLNEDFQFILALDIGQVNLTALIANLKGRVINKIEYKNYPKENRGQILNSIFDIINQSLRSTETILKKINVFSIGTHGAVDPNTSIITKAPYLKNWSGVNLVEILNSKYNKKILLNNSNNLGAIGEQWINYNNIRNLIYIDIENGVGSGIILNNKVMIGHKGTMGEISYLPILKELKIDKLKENRFKIGLFENQVDINGIVRTVKNHITNSENIDLKLKDELRDISFQEICKYYKEDSDNFVNKVINDEVIIILAVGIASLLSMIDTELVMINGDVLELGEKFIENLKKEIFSITPFRCKIVSSKLRKEAHIIGAIKSGIDHVNSIFYNNALSIIK